MLPKNHLLNASEICVGITSESFLYLLRKCSVTLYVECYTADCIMFHIVGRLDITQVAV